MGDEEGVAGDAGLGAICWHRLDVAHKNTTAEHIVKQAA
jgi:hypothetical protein